MDTEVMNLVNEVKAKADARDAEISEVKNSISALDAKLSAFSAPRPASGKIEVVNSLAKALLDGKEIRNAASGLTANGAGNIEVVSEIIRGMVDKNKLAKLVRQYWGNNAQVNIPVFLPGMAKPAGAVEGDTGKSSDSTAAFGPVSLTPYEFFAELELSRLALDTTGLEASLVDVFSDAFGQAWEYQILNGTGNYQFTGLYDATWVASVATFNSNQVKTAASATAVTFKELANIVRNIKAVSNGSESLALIVHPDVIESATTTAASNALEIEYATKGTLLNVPVIESTFAPNTMTTAKYVAVACDLRKYAAAFVRDFSVEPVKVKGTSNVYEQATVYANGKPLDKSAFYYLKLA